MAADVSYLLRALTGYKDDRTVANNPVAGKSTAMVTRDLLGGGASSRDDSRELDLDLQVPTGWEKRLDLKSGKVYLQRCSSSPSPSPSPSSSDHRQKTNQTLSKLQDLNIPSSPSKITLNLFDESNLELKLVSSSSSSSSLSTTKYQSVCTLDKVKSALERAEKEPIRKRSSLWKSPLSPSYSSSSSSVREIPEDENEEKSESATATASVAAGCPGCLSYVLIMKSNPICPRCNSVVPVPTMKKPRIDLNISI